MGINIEFPEQLKKMKCYFCGGEMKKGKTTYTINKKKKRPVSLVKVFTEGKKVVGKAFFFKERFHDTTCTFDTLTEGETTL